MRLLQFRNTVSGALLGVYAGGRGSSEATRQAREAHAAGLTVWWVGGPTETPPLKPGDYAECADCGCCGTEDVCWFCGSTERKHRYVPQSGHRHDPGTRRVYLGGEMVPTTGESYRIRS